MADLKNDWQPANGNQGSREDAAWRNSVSNKVDGITGTNGIGVEHSETEIVVSNLQAPSESSDIFRVYVSNRNDRKVTCSSGVLTFDSQRVTIPDTELDVPNHTGAATDDIYYVNIYILDRELRRSDGDFTLQANPETFSTAPDDSPKIYLSNSIDGYIDPIPEAYKALNQNGNIADLRLFTLAKIVVKKDTDDFSVERRWFGGDVSVPSAPKQAESLSFVIINEAADDEGYYGWYSTCWDEAEYRNDEAGTGADDHGDYWLNPNQGNAHYMNDSNWRSSTMGRAKAIDGSTILSSNVVCQLVRIYIFNTVQNQFIYSLTPEAKRWEYFLYPLELRSTTDGECYSNTPAYTVNTNSGIDPKEWNRFDPVSPVAHQYNSVTFPFVTKVQYSANKLYQHTRYLTFDSMGRLVNITGETRLEIADASSSGADWIN